MESKNILERLKACLPGQLEEEPQREIPFSEMVNKAEEDSSERINQVWQSYTSELGNVDTLVNEVLGDISEFEAESICNTGTLKEKQSKLDVLFGRIDEALNLINNAIGFIHIEYGLSLMIQFPGIASDSDGIYTEISEFKITEKYYDLNRNWRKYFLPKKPKDKLERAVYVPYDRSERLVPRSWVNESSRPHAHTFNFAAGGLFEATKKDAGVLTSNWVNFQTFSREDEKKQEEFYNPDILNDLQTALHSRLQGLTMLYRRVAAAKKALQPEVCRDQLTEDLKKVIECL